MARKRRRLVGCATVRKETLDMLVASAMSDQRFEGLSEALVRAWATKHITGFLTSGQYPWWYGQVDEKGKPVISDRKHRESQRGYRYQRDRELERTQQAAERVATWAQGYKTRLSRRIKAGYVIPQNALAGTGLHGKADRTSSVQVRVQEPPEGVLGRYDSCDSLGGSRNQEEACSSNLAPSSR